MAQGCRELQAEIRWVVTGTPIINGASVGSDGFLLPTTSEVLAGSLIALELSSSLQAP